MDKKGLFSKLLRCLKLGESGRNQEIRKQRKEDEQKNEKDQNQRVFLMMG